MAATASSLSQLDTTHPDDLEAEAREQLRGLLEGKTGRLPVETLVAHLMRVTAGGDWPVQRAAATAVLARMSSARRDELRVARRPRSQTGLGEYQTRRRRTAARPYHTSLWSLQPLRASCGCPDFVRNSLGLCKHVLVVVDDLLRRPRKVAQALQATSPAAGPRLRWDPVRPLTGNGSWLERVSLVPAAGANHRRRQQPRLGRWFEPGEGERPLRSLHDGDNKRRGALVADLQRFVEHERRSGQGCWDPALGRLLARERRALQRRKEQQLAPRQTGTHLRSLKRSLYPYQKEGVLRLLQAGRLLLADDMGLGKTIQAAACCHVWYRTGRVQRGLIITPASLKSQWLREWHLFARAPARVVEGSPAERRAIYAEQERGFLIANYEQVLRDLELMHAWKPDVVVLDEAQRIKNWATKTAGYVKKLQPTYRLVLTGTPMENRLEELYSLLEWVEPFALEPAWRLGPWHTIWPADGQGASGARNLDTLRQRLAPALLRRNRQEVLDQLPSRTDTCVPVSLTPVQQRAHDDLSQPIARLVQISKTRPLLQHEFLRLMSMLNMQRMICNGMALYEFTEVWSGLTQRSRPTEATLARLASPKLAELRELIANVVGEQRRKIIVFSQWRRMLRLAEWAVRDLLAAAGARAVFFTGRESQKQRTHNVVDFHDDPAAMVLFATDAGGVGLNLQRAASCCINLELPWNPAVLEQRIGRIHRLGQKSPVHVYNLVSEEGIESRVSDLVGNKKAVFTGLFDGTTDAVAFERAGTFLTRVERVMESTPSLALGDQESDIDLDDDSIGGDWDEASAMAVEATDEGETVVSPRDGAELAPAERGAQVATAASPRRAPGDAGARPAVGSAGSRADDTARSGEEVGGREPRPRVAGSGEPPLAVQVADLFAEVKVQTGSDGNMRLEAPPEVAATLASVLQGMARMLTTPPSQEAD